MKLFKNRQSAGKLLAEKLSGTKADLVLGIPRGGVVVASEIARKLKLPLDVIITRKIGAPTQPELALGAIDPDGAVIWEQELLNELNLTPDELENEIQQQKAEIKRREATYRQNREPLNISSKTIILADDGMATGATVL